MTSMDRELTCHGIFHQSAPPRRLRIALSVALYVEALRYLSASVKAS
jgi:hypothetical protein